MKAVVDTSVLIALSNIGRLEFLRELFSSALAPKVAAGEYGEPLPSWMETLEVKHEHLTHISIVSSAIYLYYEAKNGVR